PMRDDIAGQLGLSVSDIRANNNTFTSHYNESRWRAFFQNRPHCFRGVISHFINSTSTGNAAHGCPGPLLDWHRVAREVWDWWWYPFDFAVGGLDLTLQPIRRPYQRARASTPLIEYYFDALGVPGTYNAVKVPGTAIPEQFSLPATAALT